MNKPPFRIGQVWEYDDGYGFTLQVVSVEPFKMKCVKIGDSKWRVGEVNSINSRTIKQSCHCRFDFSDYLKEVEQIAN